jgi:hypothetical protein
MFCCSCDHFREFLSFVSLAFISTAASEFLLAEYFFLQGEMYPALSYNILTPVLGTRKDFYSLDNSIDARNSSRTLPLTVITAACEVKMFDIEVSLSSTPEITKLAQAVANCSPSR